MSRFYALVPWRLVTEDGQSYYAPPAGTMGLVDLRPPANQSAGYAFVTSAAPVIDPEAVNFGDAQGTRLDALAMGPARRTAWASMLGIGATIPPGSLLDVLFWTLTVLADPDGEARAKPILPTHRGMLDLHLGGHSLLRSRRFTGAEDQSYAQVRRVMQTDYRRIRAGSIAEAEAIANATSAQSPYARMIAVYAQRHGLTLAQARAALADKRARLHRRWLECMRRKCRVDWRLLIPADLPQEEPEPPKTEIGDDFTDTDGTLLTAHTPSGANGGWGSWANVAGAAEIQANIAVYFAGEARSRAETDLSSDDHYAQATDLGSNSNRRTEVMARYDAGADHAYVGRRDKDGNADSIGKRVDGVLTPLTSGVTIDAAAVVIRITVDGSSLSYTIGGVEYLTVTDTAITGNTRTGIGFYPSSGTGRSLDNFSAADLVAAGDAYPVIGGGVGSRFIGG